MNSEITETTVVLEINSLWAQTEASMQQTLKLAALTGEALNKSLKFVEKSQGQANKGHKDWLATNCPDIDYFRAMKYMKLPLQFPELLTDRASYINRLPVSSVLLILGSSDKVKAKIKTKVEADEKVTQADIAKLNAQYKEELVAKEVEMKQKHARDIGYINISNKEALEKTTKLYEEKLKNIADVSKYEAEIAKLKKMSDMNTEKAMKAGGELLKQDAKLRGQQITLTRLSNELEVALRAANNATKVAEAKTEMLKAIKFHKDSIVALEKLLK